MTRNGLAFVSLRPVERYQAALSLDGFLASDHDPERILADVERIYEKHIARMRHVVSGIQELRKARVRIPARSVWRLGDMIFLLTSELEELQLQIDGLYEHLTRDLPVKRKWLEKVVIFRRYLPDENTIPERLNWGRCEKGTRRCAEKLAKGLALD